MVFTSCCTSNHTQCLRGYQLLAISVSYLQVLLNVHRLQVVVRVRVDLQRFAVEEHLHCDEVCENPLPEQNAMVAG